MQNAKPLPPSLASPLGSSATDVVDRVIAIAAAPLLPGEKEADYAAIAGRIVVVSRPRDAIEEFLIRDVIDLTWEILRLRRVKAGQRRCTLTSTLSNGSIACRRAQRRAGTMRFAKSIVIAKRLALPFAGQSTRSKTLNSAM
jgi:hypothetical protein